MTFMNIALTSINKIIFQCNYLNDSGEIHIFQHGLNISALEQARMLILSSHFLLASLNRTYDIVTLE